MNNNINGVIKVFKNPPNEYSLVPFWFWNDGLAEEHILFQMKEMKEKGIDEAIIHSRKGRTVEYLSEEWFARVGFSLKQAEKLGMRIWIYDEDNWPSGYAGEKVLNDNPDYIAKHLTPVKKGGRKPDDVLIYSAGDKEYVMRKTLWHPAYSPSYYAVSK